jgi:hypothetical protein
MKKYLLVFFAFSFFAIIYLSVQHKPLEASVAVDKSKFVVIENKKFSLLGKPFYPLTLNYIVDLQADKKEVWPTGYVGYNKTFRYRYITKDSALMQLKADMDLIKEMGFNSVRLVGIGEESIMDKITGKLSYKVSVNNLHDSTIEFTNDTNYEKYYSAVDTLFGIIKEAGLKAVLLMRMSPDARSTEEHLKKMAVRFKDNNTIMAYDLFNEPLYFEEIDRKKEDVIKICKRWTKVLHTYAPCQLVTIGLSGIREVFEWDPNILNVDFVSFHPYEYEPEQVRNEMYWYGKYVTKPWIIGETAIPADNDSVTYETQKQFAHNTLKQAYDCGAIGYSWWQYKDVDWHNYHANFMGVVNRNGETKTIKPNIAIKGTVKPLVEEFKNFSGTVPKGTPVYLNNYYNYSNGKACKIMGRLLDEDDKPIEGGVVLGWNQYWSHSYHTISKKDGSFELLGTFPFYHWMASATRYSMVRADVLPDSAKNGFSKIPTMNVGNLKLERVSFGN